MNTLNVKIQYKQFLVDVDDFDKLLVDADTSPNDALIRWKITDNDLPYYYNKSKNASFLVDKIMGQKCHNKIKFKDGNKLNYSKNNLQIIDEDTIQFQDKLYVVVKKYDGIINYLGRSSGEMKNSIYKVTDLEDDDINYIYLMDCTNDYTIISEESIDTIHEYDGQTLTWYKLKSGYIGSHIKNENDEITILYLHKHVKNYYKDKKIIRHLNDNRLDNRIENLKKQKKKDNDDSDNEFNDDVDSETKENIIDDLTEPKNVKILRSFKPYEITSGKFAGQVRNMYWEVEDNKTNEKYYMMSCRNSDKEVTYFKTDKHSIVKVLELNYKRPTWHIGQNGYVKSTYRDDNYNKREIYLHQYITGHYGNGQGQDSVDHINRNKLDNRIENLRIISQSEQNKNTGKRARKYNAKDLPDGITHDMLPKYVVYYNECYNKEKDLYRDFFKIEKHPNQEGKEFCSSKSTKISIQDKLTEIIEMLNRIENNEEIIKVTDKTTYNLAKGTYIKDNKDGSQHLILDLRQDGERYNLKMKCKKNLSMADNYKLFEEKINDKYEDIELQY